MVEKFDIADKIQVNTDVTELRYVEENGEWEVDLSYLVAGAGDLSANDRRQRIVTHGKDSIILKQETIRAKIVISCVGILVEPNAWPASIAGRETFQGDVVHTGRWREDIDFHGKDVVVIGSGCSAAQIVPTILNEPYNVKSVTQIMRTPPWIGPAIPEPFGREAYARTAPTIFHYFPLLGYFFRISLFLMVEMIFASAFKRTNVKWRSMFEDDGLKRMRSKAPEKYHAIMTPNYPYGSKRRLFGLAWLESMNKSNYHLTTQVLESVKLTAVTLGPASPAGADSDPDTEMVQSAAPVDVHADIIILANGYNATRWIHPLAVYGRGSKSLQDIWDERGGPQAYMGIALDGFPNFFMIGGPNTASGHWSLILATENMIGYILKIIKPVLREDALFAEVKKQAALDWSNKIQSDLQNTVFQDSKSWYQDENGFNSTMYP